MDEYDSPLSIEDYGLPPLDEDDDDLLTDEYGLPLFDTESSTEPDESTYTVSDFLAYINQTLAYTYSDVVLEGEVSSFKINQGKWVFFDLKDDSASLGCFLPIWDLRTELEDGMKVRLRGFPKVTQWGKFSFTVKEVIPVGQGSIKKAFDLLKERLTKEGLFDPAKKRQVDIEKIKTIGVISSTQAAGYADFIKITGERWGGLKIQVAHTGVQGLGAADQIIRALSYFNEQGTVDVIALIRGGGSADDLAVFNDEKLVRAIAASRIPIITGIGHEVDESLSDLAADIKASTPSNAAQFLTRDRHAEIRNIKSLVAGARQKIFSEINSLSALNLNSVENIKRQILSRFGSELDKIRSMKRTLNRLNPDLILKQGYSIISGKLAPGSSIKIETHDVLATAVIKSIAQKE